MANVNKHLDRAKKFLEKNRVGDAIEAYLSVLEEAPSHMEATQALGDLYARREQPDRAAVYYGMFFDLLVDPKDETKALAIYNRFLKHGAQQPPERIARYAFLQQRQNRTEEASEQYGKAAELFTAAAREEDALFCWERIAQLEPDNLPRQIKLADVAEKSGRNLLAARALLRAGQLASVSGAADDSLKFLQRAHRLAPQERSVALLYAAARLRKGDAADAAKLLEPFSASETDPVFLETFADALMRSGQLDRARTILEKCCRRKMPAWRGCSSSRISTRRREQGQKRLKSWPFSKEGCSRKRGRTSSLHRWMTSPEGTLAWLNFLSLGRRSITN